MRRRINQDIDEPIGEFIVKIKSFKEFDHPLTRVGNFLNHGVFKIVGKLSQLMVFENDLEFVGKYEPRFKSILNFDEIEKISRNLIQQDPKRSISTQTNTKISISVTLSLGSVTEQQKKEEIVKISQELNLSLMREIGENQFFPIQVISINQMEMEFSPLVSSKVGEILKSHPNVHFIEKVLKISLLNKSGYQLSQSVSPNIATKSTPFYDLGIYGNGQIIGLSDTGIDHDHCFFRDSSVTLTTNFLNKNHRKIISYNRIQFQFNGKVITTDNKDDVSGHGSHVAGTIAGSMEGTDYTDPINQYHGIAPKSKLFFMDMKDSSNENMFMSNDLTVLFTPGYSAGARIFSNSFGTSASVYVTCSFDCKNCKTANSFGSFNVGDSISDSQCQALFGSSTCCSITNLYTSSPQNLDKFLWNNQEAVVLFASGNDGAMASQGTLTEQANSKNAIIVGASRTTNEDLLSSLNYEDYYTKIKEAALDLKSPEQCCLQTSVSIKAYCCPSYIESLFKNSVAYNEKNIASFSSRGPAYGGRIKPDLVAVGESVVSAHSDGSLTTNQCGKSKPQEGNDAALLAKRGSSMSCPLTAGSSALIREYLETQRGISNPSGHLVKALLVHSAVQSKGTVSLDGNEANREELSSFYQPNHVEGHGILSLGSLLKTESGKDVALTLIQNSFTASSQTNQLCFKVVGSGSWFKSTLAWYDYPSDISSFVPLINDLDLIVNTFRNEGSGASNLVVYGGNDLGAVDNVNNLEKVVIDSLNYSPSTTNYVSLSVYMNKLASVTASQPYSLVLSYPNGTLTQVDNSLCTYSKEVPARTAKPNITAAIVVPIVGIAVLFIIVVSLIAVLVIFRFWKSNEIKRRKSVKAAAVSSSAMPEMTDFTPTY